MALLMNEDLLSIILQMLSHPSSLLLLLLFPLAAHSDDCALIIPGDQFDACITFEAVNAAFLSARDSVGLPPAGREFSTEDVGNLGTVIQEASRFLAEQYGLSRDAIASGLPLIDTTKTVIESYCPSYLMTPHCKVGYDLC